MKSISRYLFLAFALLLTFVGQAFAITATSPVNGSQVGNPFPLSAAAPTCNNIATTAFGYSLDYGPTTMVGTPYTGLVLTTVGSHTLHLKAWNSAGNVCTQAISIKVTDTAPASLPTGITATYNIQKLTSWKYNHDAGTPGTSTGTMTLTSSPSLSGSAAHFAMSYTNYGGEIYHTSFGSDTAAHNFIYDTRVYLASPVELGNLEMDMNQVTANGQTVIYGFQCDGYSNTWDYTLNTGTAAAPNDTWVHSNVACSPSTWATDTWHHVQIAYSRDDNGNVTYTKVALDGVESDLTNASGFDSFALGWGSVLLTNFQLDGKGASGSNSAYADQMTVYRW